MAKGTCTVEGCDSAQFCRTWCIAHYGRWTRTGTPLGKPEFIPATCSIHDCEERSLARGWCRLHWARWQKHGDPLFVTPKPIPVREKPCTVPKCSTPQVAKGLCTKHWRRARYETHSGTYLAQNHRRRARLRGAAVNDFTAEQWEELKAAYGQRCAYCGRKKKLTMDHVVPLSAGGDHTKANIVPACPTCNYSKGARPAPTFQPVLL